MRKPTLFRYGGCYLCTRSSCRSGVILLQLHRLHCLHAGCIWRHETKPEGAPLQLPLCPAAFRDARGRPRIAFLASTMCDVTSATTELSAKRPSPRPTSKVAWSPRELSCLQDEGPIVLIFAFYVRSSLRWGREKKREGGNGDHGPYFDVASS